MIMYSLSTFSTFYFIEIISLVFEKLIHRSHAMMILRANHWE